ncbi:hypothetical protein [Aquabacterium sp.]|uniref:hypothetical protein n=1 Tax=Aquabacterium sp. TaxID=1872578 RepID=UPI002C6D0AF7|nr:hypothetical protein [Aquabacterium sp.]HSW08968.1 hypothetical protein [Aquabacterium sp.]
MRVAVFGAIGVAIVALLMVLVYQNQRRFHRPQITAPYHAVTFTNGSVFYGRIDHLGTDHPVLRDAFSVAGEAAVEAGRPRLSLVKRKNEINGADHIIFPITAVLYIEPVRPDSIAGRLIEQANKN